MSTECNIKIVKHAAAEIGGGVHPDEIAASFAEDLVFEIQGDDGVCLGSVARPGARRWPTSCAISAP